MKKWDICPSLNKRKLSEEKVENVVKPPHNPTVKKRRRSGDIRTPFSRMPYIKPSRRHPAILTVRVPKGKEDIADA